MTLRRLALTAAVALTCLAGCANGGQTGSPAPAPASPSSIEVPSVPAPSASAGDVTISGTIDAGVEPGCILLDKHLLIIKDEAQKSIAAAGATVTVTGHPVKGMMTTCMQGTPFLVTSIQAS